MQIRQPVAAIFAALWTAYMAYSFLTQSGLYAAAVSWQSSTFGSYDPILTILGMWLVPTIIALFIAFPKSFAAAAEANYGNADQDTTEGDPAESVEIDRLGTNIRIFGWAMPLCLLVVGGATAIGLKLPSGHAAPTVIDMATLGDSAPAKGRIQLEGTAITDAMMGIEEDMDGSITISAFVPIVATGTEENAGSAAAPFQYFQKVETRGTDPAPSLFNRVGYLKQQALPVLVREGYEEYGIAVAKKTFVLDSSALNMRETLFMTAALAGVFLIIIFAIWLGFIIRRARLRKALRQSDPLS